MALTIRQRILKTLYPFFSWLSLKKTGEKVIANETKVTPLIPFHSLSAVLSTGNELSFERLKGKKILLVNTASDCGFTPQYTELQKLYQQAKEDLEIIAFPANDFKEQEKGSDEEIATFCSRNYGVSFPIAKKATVIKDQQQHPVFQWLTSRQKNGWNDKAPSWNFAKYLVNEQGILTHYFEPAVSPLSEEIIRAINH